MNGEIDLRLCPVDTNNFGGSLTGHISSKDLNYIIWTATSEFGTYRLCEQRRFRRACASAQSRQNLRCSLIQLFEQICARDLLCINI